MNIILSADDTATLTSGGEVTLTITGSKAVAPPVVPPPAVSPGVALKTIISQNGATPLMPVDYTYGGTRAAVSGGDGNAQCVALTATGQWAGYTPSNNNGVSTDFSQCENIVVSLKASVPKQQWSMQFFVGPGVVTPVSSGTDVPVVEQGSTTQQARVYLPRSTDPAVIVGQWQRYSIPKALLMTDWRTGSPVDVSGKIYKGTVQDLSGLTNAVTEIDNWGGV